MNTHTGAIGRIVAEIAKQEVARRFVAAVDPKPRSPESGSPTAPASKSRLASLSSLSLVAQSIASVIGDGEAFRRWTYLQRGEQPPETRPESPTPNGPDSPTEQPQEPTGDLGRVVSALAMGGANQPPNNETGSSPPEVPYTDLVQRFNRTVGQFALRPKGQADQPEAKRELRRAAAAVRRQSPIGSPNRVAARDAAIVGRPTADERQKWLETRRQASKNRPRDEKGRFLPAGKQVGQQPATDRPQAAQPRRSGFGFMDTVQTGLDVAGVADPTPIIDWSNAAISLGRAAIDPERRGEHLQNAAISGVSGAVPYAGDAAKLLKVPRLLRRARGAGRAVEGAKAAKAVPSLGERFVGSAVGTAFGPAARKQWNTFRKRRRVAAASGSAGASGGGNGGGRGRGPRVATGAEGPGDDRPRSPFKRAMKWASQIGSPQQERQGDESRGRRKVHKAMDSFTDKLKESAKGLAKLGVVTIAAFEGLRVFNSGVIAGNRDLAQYNGRLAVAYGQYRADEIRRSIRGGEAVDEPLSKLVEGQSKLQDIRQSFTDPLKKIGLTIEEKLTTGAGTILEAGDRFTGASKTLDRAANVFAAAMKLDVQGMRDVWDGKAGKPEAIDNASRFFLRDISDGKFDGKAPKFDDRRPANFRSPRHL